MILQSVLRRALMIVVVGVAMTPRPGMADPGSEQRLSFDVDEGLNLNWLPFPPATAASVSGLRTAISL
jgi:hypothetical protein